jgi:hypothetical protein
MDFVSRPAAGGYALVREAAAGNHGATIREIAVHDAREEERLFGSRRQRRPQPALRPRVTIAGSGLVIALAGISILLIRPLRQCARRGRGVAA